MKKVLIGIVVVILLGTGAFVMFRKPTAPPVEPPIVVEPTPTPEELAVWNDQNGFTFQYPKQLKMNTHDEDTENYAHLEFTNPDHPGSVIVWGKDTKAASAAAWMKSDKTLASGVMLETTMGGKPGSKVMVETPKKRMVTAVIDDGVVFYVEGNLEDSEYWTNVHSTITSTFAFTYNKPTTSAGEETSSEEYIDEEEVIE